MNSYYRKRYLDGGFMTGNIYAETINAGNRWNKEWFIQQMEGMGCRRGQLDGKPVSQTYVDTFRNKKCSHPESNSWMALFGTYQAIKTEMTEGVKGTLVPNINDLMEEIVVNTTWDPKLDDWFKIPIGYLSGIGSLHVSEVDRKSGEPGVMFTMGNVDHNLKLGYRELFSIPKFGEIYCETESRESIHLSDVLMAMQIGEMPTRYYSIMMCDKLPPEVFECRHR